MKNPVHTDSAISFDGRKGKRLSREIVSDLRFFGFYIGNESLENIFPDIRNMSIVFEPSDALGNLYAFRLFRDYDKKGERSGNTDLPGSYTMIAEYINCLNNNQPVTFSFPFTKQELTDPKDWRAVLARFMLDFGNRKLDTVPLKDFDGEDYAYDIIDYGSGLELLTAIFCNILRMDKAFNVINEEWCRHRASQYIRAHHDDAYRIEPPLKEWETTLWL